ncbi:CD48 antigen-like [Ammospiza nelsoni]|uniref:CD48 antigen-like n=1 Tax=Ammospiza caudacuta TaxID=2857398 RepID=UPI0027397BB4|nr:CD48 antigen-like [Ammospiza caudacuta]XP_059346443.1 CD48 antigen-like [Ammospiza nelsoni]
MAPALELNLLLFLLFTTPARAQEPQPLEVAGAVGGVALLNPQTPQNPSEYSQIHWRWQKLRIASLKRGEQPRYPQTRFEGRLELLENGILRMSNLSLGDSGEFRLYLEDDTGRESVQRVLLRVYDLVPKPHVTATTNGDPQVCNTTLSCSVALQGVTYEWIPPQKAPMKQGPVLEVSINPAVETYVCKVSNPVSSSNASLTLRRPCSWTDESSSSSTHTTPNALVALGHLVLLFLLLAVA